MTLGSFDRATNVAQLAETHFDLVVIGGGVTGAGVALDAASRGLRTALIERDDFGSGSSAGPVALIDAISPQPDLPAAWRARKVLAEVDRLRANAPHLTSTVPLGMANPGRLREVLRWYDTFDRHRLGAPARLLGEAPFQVRATLVDPARLALGLARTAALDHGAVVANRVSAVSVGRDDAGLVTVVEAVDGEGGALRIATRAVVNATGLDAGALAAADGQVTPHTLMMRDVVAVVAVDPPAAALVTSDPAMVAIPWDGRLLVAVSRPADDLPAGPHSGDVDAVTAAAGDRFGFDAGDVLSLNVHRRVVVAGDGPATEPTARQRIHVGPDGVISVIGGNLARYRARAADVVDAVIARLDDRTRLRLRRRSPTSTLRLRGAVGHREFLARGAPGLDSVTRAHLAARYGGESRLLLALCAADPALAQRLHPDAPFLAAEVAVAARFEMARSVADVLVRRVPLTGRNPAAAMQVAAHVAEALGDVLGWTSERRGTEAAAFTSGRAPLTPAATGTTAASDTTAASGTSAASGTTRGDNR